jgi:arsenate reductase
MKELGIDISGHRSKHVDEFQGQSFNYVLTVCDNARESCPIFPGHSKRMHKAFDDRQRIMEQKKNAWPCFAEYGMNFATI